MRQWLVNPKLMCRKHLLGEHVEHHMVIGSLKKGTSVRGFLKNNLLEPSSIIARHDEIAAEMVRRGYEHRSHILEREEEIKVFFSDKDYEYKIDRIAALSDLLGRCLACRNRAKK